MDYGITITDVLIIGGGGAGVRAAIEADLNGVSVALVTKGNISRSGLTPMAGYSFQAAFGHENPRDNPRVHFDDTIREGRHLADENLVWALANEATERALELEDYGVKFTKRDGKFDQVRHPGQSYPRINQIPGRGYQMMVGLRAELLRHKSITVFEDCFVHGILSGSDGQPSGAVAFLQRKGGFHVFQFKSLILATGGYEELWQTTDCAPDSTGDGIALAFSLGAELVDLEMMLYYPIVTLGSRIYRSMNQTLQYESLLEEEYLGGKLVNARGEEFLPPGRLPARDVLTQLIVRERLEGRATERGGVFIDLSRSSLSAEEMEKRIDLIGARVQFNRVKYLGVDLSRDPVEVAPACHYSLGGVRINEWAKTSVPGLFAAGEVSGNVHGANRISGNALAETQVFGRRAGEAASREALRRKNFFPLSDGQIKVELSRVQRLWQGKKDPLRPIQIRKKIQGIMEQKVGLMRDNWGLSEAIDFIASIAREDISRIQVSPEGRFNYELQDALEVTFMVQVAELVARAARMRRESRGHHFRSDFPAEEDSWGQHTLLRKDGNQVLATTAPVVRLVNREESACG